MLQRYALDIATQEIVVHGPFAPLAVRLRAHELRCPYCKDILGWDTGGFVHLQMIAEPRWRHAPLDASWHKHTLRLERRFKRLFDAALVQRYVGVEQHIIDLVLITPSGGRLGVIMPMSSEGSEIARLRVRRELLVQEGAQPLILLPAEIVSLRSPKKSQTERVRLQDMELAVLQMEGRLWLITDDDQILHVTPHPDTRDFWALGRPLGFVEAVIRRYPLSQFRLNTGLVAMLEEWDPQSPEFQELPDRLKRRLDP